MSKWYGSKADPPEQKGVKMEAYAVMAYRCGCCFYKVFDERTEAVEDADQWWNQMCDEEKASYRFFCVAQIELDDNGAFSIHGAVPIKNYKIRKRVFIKNKINKLLNFMKRKG
jgi:hypothetical protein